MFRQHSEKATRPSLADVQTVLLSEITKWTKVYIVVDAVDEYPEDERCILLKDLLSMGPTVNLMTTSRPHITLAASVANLETIDIRAKPDDIRPYVDACIQKSSRLSKHVETRASLREEIHSKITDSVDGM
jgi:hypothetical protein